MISTSARLETSAARCTQRVQIPRGRTVVNVAKASLEMDNCVLMSMNVAKRSVARIPRAQTQ